MHDQHTPAEMSVCARCGATTHRPRYSDAEPDSDLLVEMHGCSYCDQATMIPDWLAERADRFYAAAYDLHDSAIGANYATGADWLAGELQDRACAIYAEWQS